MPQTTSLERITDSLDTFSARYNEDDNAWWMLDAGQHQVLFDAAVEQRNAARAEAAALRADAAALRTEVEWLRQKVVDAVHSGIAGASRAYQNKIDEAAFTQRIAEIDRDAAIAEVERLRAAIVNVRRNLELHADDWQDSYRTTAIAALSDTLEE